MGSTAEGSSNDGDILLYTRKEIFLVVKGHLHDSIADLLEHLSAELSKKSGRPLTIADNMKQSFSALFNKMRTKWQSTNRHENYFFKKHAKWLDVQVSFPVPGPSQATPALTETATCGRPSPDFDPQNSRVQTFIQIVLIFGIFGAIRTHEFTNILVHHIKQQGNLLQVQIPETKTLQPRSFIIAENCVKYVKHYQSLRPNNVPSERFFLNYQNGKCTSHVIGKNKFAGMPRQVAEFLNLPNAASYTGHSLRRTSATVLVDEGANIETLHRHGGWKSSTVAERYIAESSGNKKNIGEMIMSYIDSPSTSGGSHNAEASPKGLEKDDSTDLFEAKQEPLEPVSPGDIRIKDEFVDSGAAVTTSHEELEQLLATAECSTATRRKRLRTDGEDHWQADDPKLSAVLDILKKLSDRDDSGVYGEYVAMKMRSYSTETKSMVQHLFSNVLFDADMGKFDNPFPAE